MKSKKIRTKGKLQLSRYFKKFENGDFVSVTPELSLQPRFPKRIEGETGIVEGKQGKAIIVKIKKKKYLIEPIHLRRLK